MSANEVFIFKILSDHLAGQLYASRMLGTHDWKTDPRRARRFRRLDILKSHNYFGILRQRLTAFKYNNAV